MKIAVGLPAYNEEKNISSIISKLKKYSFSIIVCDDGSTDSTKKIAEEMETHVISHPKNLGYGAAIKSIFDKARELEFDILVTFDADGQHDESEIQNVIDPILKNQADIVIGSRFIEDMSSKIPKYRVLGIKAITKLSNFTSKNNLKDSQSGFRAYSKDVIKKIHPIETGMGVSTEILIKASKENFKIVEVPITVSYEGETSTNHPVSHGVSVILSTMKYTSIEHPLKFYGISGLIFLSVGLFFIVWTLQEFGLTRAIITNLALIGIGMTLLGVILLVTGIMLFSIVSVIKDSQNR